MKATNRSVSSTVLAAALLAAVTGCTTYVQQPATRTVYVTTPPPPVEAPPPAPAPAPTVVVIQTENDFYEPLSPYGEWVVVESYGRVWRPARVNAGWRPYSNGHWQRSDAGWYWASEEPWGWATYHYGRWDRTVQFGWIWVPQTQWAPAWVSWREGAGYVGWAPLPPSARISINGSVEVREAIIAPHFVFVEERRLLEPVRPTTIIVNNTTVINKTKNITKIKIVNKTVVNEGPRTEVVERESGRKIEAVPAHELRHREETEVAARRHNSPVAGDNRNNQPPTRTGHEPVKAVLPRDAHVSEEHADSVKERQPVVTETKTREIDERKPDARPDQPEVRGTGRDENKPAAVVATDSPNPQSEPDRAIPTREPRRVEPPKETPPPANVSREHANSAKERQPAVTETRTREIDERKPAARADRPEVRGTGRNENKPAAVAATDKPNPHPASDRAIPAREPRRVESPKETPPPARVAAPEVKPAPAPAVLPRVAHQVDNPNRTENARSEAAPRQSAPPAGRPAETQVRSPKAVAAASEDDKGDKKKDQKKPDQKKKGEQPDNPVTPPPPQ